MNVSGKILFVDDDALFLSAVERTLRNRFVFDTAVSGPVALERIRSQGPYAVIVSDIGMPGMDGLTLLAKVASLAPETVQVVLTGKDDVETFMASVKQTKVFRYIAKSFDSSPLREALEDALKEYAMLQGIDGSDEP